MLHHLIQPLLAVDAGQVISALVGLGILLLSVIKQIVEANKKAKSSAPRPQPASPKTAGPAGGPATGGQADPLRNQVDEFLRRAGQPAQGKDSKSPPRSGRPAAPEIEVLIDDRSRPPRRPPLSEPLRPVAPTANVSQLSPPARQPAAGKSERPRTAPRSPGPRRASVADHVAEHVAARSRNLSEQASNLGRRIIQEDEQFDVQIKAKFDHAVGTLTGSARSVEEQVLAPGTAAAADIAAMLANPDGVRQAILVNEILRRPSERW